MATITPNYQIAAGNNNAGGLTVITSITDANSVPFIMPRGLPFRRRGQRKYRLDTSVVFDGYDTVQWLFSIMTLAQYKHLIDTYEGLVTIKTALTTTTFANFNATLWLPDENELEYVYLTGSNRIANFTGPGYRDVLCNFILTGAL